MQSMQKKGNKTKNNEIKDKNNRENQWKKVKQPVLWKGQ
jgi:hypothetical protein